MMGGDKDKQEKDKDAAGVAWGIACIWAVSITTIIRRRCGRNFIGIRMILAPALIALWACFTHEQLMFWMIPVFAVSAFFQGNQERSARKRGNIIHSYYSGEPVILGILTKNEQFAKSVIEPGMALAFGIWSVNYWSDGLGRYFIIGAVMMFIVEAMGKIQWRHEEDAMSDAMIEAYYRSSTVRRM